jgi:septum formation protein
LRRLILASTSTARAAILQGAGVTFEAIVPGVDEGEIKARLVGEGHGPLVVARTLAARKAVVVSQRYNALVAGADQTLECEGALIDKAASAEEARQSLLRLRGRGHFLHCAVALAEAGEVVWSAHETAQMFMRDFSEAFLADYLAREGERLLTTVGGYRLEGEGAQLFERIEGDYFAILGLPLLPLLGALRARGALAT